MSCETKEEDTVEVLSKDKIEQYIIPQLSVGRRGSKIGVEVWRIVQAILYRLKTGCQWRLLPIRTFFESTCKITWQGVYYHFKSWIKDGSFKKVWIELLRNNCRAIDMSSVQLDGSQTRVRNGGEYVGYQGRKKAKTTNTLFLCDNEGQPLSLSTPQSGDHHDLYDIERSINEICDLLTDAGITVNGVFLNADSGFDSAQLKSQCASKGIEANIDTNSRNKKSHNEWKYFDEELYKRRFVIERMNAWIDGFKALLIRFETKNDHWKALHFLAFTIIMVRKLNVKY